MPPTPVPNASTVGSDALHSRALSDLTDATAVADVGTVYVTALGGAIDPWMLIALHRRITDALDAGDDRVVLDLSAVTVLGGVTVGVLCGVLRRLAGQGATIAVAGGTPHVQAVLGRCAIDGLEQYPAGEVAFMAAS